MAWRKWFVRGVVITVVSCCAVAAYAYQQWTNPAAVREQVLAKLKILFPGADVAVDSAGLRLMGGIKVSDARLSRRDDPDRNDAVQIPSAILYPDKEKLLEGEVPLRKVELFRPRFRLYRNNDGKWNLQGIIGPQRLDRAIPTLVIHQGTLLLEDRATVGNISSLEITDFNLTLINDPLTTVKFEGVAQSPLVGKVTIVGSWQRASGELSVSIKTKDSPLNAKLLQRIAPFLPPNALKDLEVTGLADIDAKVESHPARSPSLHYDVAFAVHKTNVKHPLLPLPLEELEASGRVVDGVVTLDRAQARADGTVIRATAVSQFPNPDQAFEARIEVDGLRVTDDLIERLPAKKPKDAPRDYRDVIRDFHPEGTVGVRLTLAKRDDRWIALEDGSESTITILPEKAACMFEKFRYPIQGLIGAIEYPLASKKMRFHLAGRAAGQPVTLRGYSQGAGIDLDLALDIHAANVSIDETILQSLPAGEQKVARSFHAKGKFDAAASIRHRPGIVPFENSFLLNFRDCEVDWETFPLPLSRVSGQLDINPARWEFRDFRGQHEGGIFHIKGRSFPVAGKEKPGVDIEVRGMNVALSPALHRALDPTPGLKRVWNSFEPSGAMNFEAVIHRPTDAIEDLEVQVQAEGLTVEPKFFKYRMTDLAGIVHFQKNRLEVGEVSAKHGSTRFVLPAGNVDLKPGGGYYARLPLIDAQGLRLDADFIKAIPDSLRTAADMMQLHDPLRVTTELIVAQSADVDSQPDIYWNAKGWVKDATFVAGVPIENVTGVVACRGRHNGAKIIGLEGNVLLDEASVFKQPFKNIKAHFQVEENTPNMLMAGISAPLFDGDITGIVRVDFQQIAKFELDLSASQIDVKKFGHHNMGDKSQMEGKAVGRLHLTGTSEGIKSLSGHGRLGIIAAKLYNLPLILDLLKFLGLRWPDRTAFEEVHALFRITGPRVSLRELELQGNAVSLSGRGDFNLDGTDLHVDFYPTWARIEQMLPPALRSAPAAVSKNFLIIEMRGKVTSNPDDLKFNKRFVPILLDPLMNIRDRVMGPVNENRRNDSASQRLPPPQPLPPVPLPEPKR